VSDEGQSERGAAIGLLLLNRSKIAHYLKYRYGVLRMLMGVETARSARLAKSNSDEPYQALYPADFQRVVADARVRNMPSRLEA
jgi:hypothetical protein